MICRRNPRVGTALGEADPDGDIAGLFARIRRRTLSDGYGIVIKAIRQGLAINTNGAGECSLGTTVSRDRRGDYLGGGCLASAERAGESEG